MTEQIITKPSKDKLISDALYTLIFHYVNLYQFIIECGEMTYELNNISLTNIKIALCECYHNEFMSKDRVNNIIDFILTCVKKTSPDRVEYWKENLYSDLKKDIWFEVNEVWKP